MKEQTRTKRKSGTCENWASSHASLYLFRKPRPARHRVEVTSPLLSQELCVKCEWVSFPQSFLSDQKCVIISQQAPLGAVTSHKSLRVTCPILVTGKQDWTQVPFLLVTASCSHHPCTAKTTAPFLICRSLTFPVQCSTAKSFALQALVASANSGEARLPPPGCRPFARIK